MATRPRQRQGSSAPGWTTRPTGSTPKLVRNGLSHDLAVALLKDMRAQVDFLDSLDGPIPRPKHARVEFHH